MQNNFSPLLFLASGAALLVACSSAPAVSTDAASASLASSTSAQLPASTDSASPSSASSVDVSAAEAGGVPESYKAIEFPEYKYVAPYPKDYRVQIADGITGYIVSDRSLPLVNFAVYFEEPRVVSSQKDEAASEMVGTMLRRGAGGGITPAVLDDSLEFISASLSSGVGTFLSTFDIDCLSKDFPGMLELSRKVLTAPALDKSQLEIVKANYVTAYDRRYDTPAKVLSALKYKVNYVNSPRMWDADAEEYRKVSVDDVKRLASGVYSSRRIVFALSGDVDRDSAVVALKAFFDGWKVTPAAGKSGASSVKTPYAAPEQLGFLRKPGIYVVDRDITQANISMNQPFVKRPHPDYYPSAVASFILGGGTFNSRLMTRVRSDEGLAYSIRSSVGNDYRDTSMTTIALQTKVESVGLALKLIYEELDKLAKDGPTAEELELAKRSMVESLPSLFDSPSSTAEIFAEGELLGKSDDHYLDYVKEINAVTAEQVKAMVAKYFDKSKMTISIVAPVSKLDALKPFTVVPLDSLEFR